jgi:syntaxin 7
LDNEIVYNEAVIEEREQGIQEIQQQIGEVNEIFKDLAVLVHDQGAVIGIAFLPICTSSSLLILQKLQDSQKKKKRKELTTTTTKPLIPKKRTKICKIEIADDIDTHIENSVAATAQARAQLVKAAKTQKSSSSLVTPFLLPVLYIYIYFFASTDTKTRNRKKKKEYLDAYYHCNPA